MNLKTGLLLLTVMSLLVFSCYTQAQQVYSIDKHNMVSPRSIPQPHPDHPGNVYLAGESVKIVFPRDLPDSAAAWQLSDDRRQVLRQGDLTGDEQALSVGTLPVGWYRVDFLDKDAKALTHSTAAVLARLKAATPPDSPICVDSATAWFARDDRLNQEYLASLAALAGVNWVRDRLSWNEIQPDPGSFTAARTTYDTAAEIQSRWGLKVLQTFHRTPDWATDKQLDPEGAGGRFPRDLRHIYNFCRGLAGRFRGQVGAWEPWNESNVASFGGHTIDEMCSFQKAAYLGFKAGDPDLVVGWNAYASSPTQTHTDGLACNQTLPYYDTYNIHTYDWSHSYDKLWPPARQATGGKPLWVTESDRGIHYVGEEPWCELSPESEIQKAEFIAQEYAQALFAGSSRHFHFILGHYRESHNHVQFGLLRMDNTPRPAYVALAALGRLLAGAQCMGQLAVEDPAHVYVFRAKPDGKEADVMVAWAEKQVDWDRRSQTAVAWPLPDSVTVRQVYDYLGRDLNGKVPESLNGQPLFLILAKGDAEKLNLEKPPTVPAVKSDPPSAIVMQAQLPQKYIKAYAEKEWSQGYLYQMPADREHELTLWVYNFNDDPVTGTITTKELPAGWQVTPGQWRVEVAGNGRKKIVARLSMGKDDKTTPGDWLKFHGKFSSGEKSALALLIQAQ